MLTRFSEKIIGFKTWRLCVFALAVVLFFPLSAPAQTPVPTPLVIQESQVPIRVDGHLDDWPSARMFLLDQASQVVAGKVYWKGSEDFNGRVFITYDALYLYAAVIVEKKDKPANDNVKNSLWNGDCLELFLATQSTGKESQRPFAGDYHIGFSPGTDCENPRMFCFNKNEEIPGGRVIARVTQKGYLMEACVPLTFFKGLDLGPGKVAGLNLALDEGGRVSGNRLAQLDLSGNSQAQDHPGTWTRIQWQGSTELAVPKADEEGFQAGTVADGTKGGTYTGVRTITGLVLGEDGKPLIGARVSTWPETQKVLTDAAGNFTLDHIKLYDKTLLYAREEGTGVALALLPGKGESVTLVPKNLPVCLANAQGLGGPLWVGQTVKVSPDGTWDDGKSIQTKASALGLKILRLSWAASVPEGADHQILDRFVAFARSVGAEPMVEVPVHPFSPQRAADWVRYCDLEKKYGVALWTIGDEPDMEGGGLGVETSGAYSVYDYINDFRDAFNTMKTVDTDIFILGPELAWKYADDQDDWLTPFLRCDGDIVDAVSVHRYAALKAGDCGWKNVWSDIRSGPSILHNVREKIWGNSDISIPLVVTGGNTCKETGRKAAGPKDAEPGSFWAALWTAEEWEAALGEKLGMNIFSYLEGGSGLDAVEGEVVSPAYYAEVILGGLSTGKRISAQIKKEDISVTALQDEKTKDLSLLFVNKGDDYYRPKASLDGKDADLTVEAGLKQGLDFEIPSFSIACLKIKADNSPGESVLYTKKMFQAGKGPETKVLKPW